MNYTYGGLFPNKNYAYKIKGTKKGICYYRGEITIRTIKQIEKMRYNFFSEEESIETAKIKLYKNKDY